MTKTNAYFYKDKPLFGLDIGFSSLKVMQITSSGKRKAISGYGVARFDPGVIKDGVIVDPENIAKAAQKLFEKHLIGDITTRRVAVAIPSSRAFNRTMKLPKEAIKDLSSAVLLEAEQYIPVPANELYIDYEIISKDAKETELLVVAVPKKIADSYLRLVTLMGLEPVAFETSIASAARLFVQAEQSDMPTILIDFGSISSDITIYDHGLVVTGTVSGGGDIFTELIAKRLGVNKEEAALIKTKYGLGLSKKQAVIKEALAPALEQLLKEVRRSIRYFEERGASQRKIAQIVNMGGGANMPGLSEYMTDTLRLPSRTCNPWQYMDFSGLQPPHDVEKSLYVTVAGLALLNPKELFSS